MDDRVLRVISGDAREVSFDVPVDGQRMRVHAVGLRGGGALMPARDLSGMDAVLRRLLVILGLVCAGGVALAAGLGLAISRTALRPVADFTRRTEELAETDVVTHRLPADGDDEIARLARSFNTTLDALERWVDARRRLIADASHELRTPVASLRANLQLLMRESAMPGDERAALARDVTEQLDELSGIVSDVVEPTRGAQPDPHPEDVRLDHVMRRAIERTQRHAPRMRFETRLAPTVVVEAPERLFRAAVSLLDTAVKWSPEGGPVEVVVDDGAMEVRDHGPGFRPDDLPFVFGRFYRSEAARDMQGSGLGLAIVRQVAETYGGTVDASNAEGGGARVRIAFPRLPMSAGESAWEHGSGGGSGVGCSSRPRQRPAARTIPTNLIRDAERETNESAVEQTGRMPDETRMGPVYLTVSDLERSIGYYRDSIGLQERERGRLRAALGTSTDDLVVLVEEPGVPPARAYSGLYHVAFRVPQRRDLAKFLVHAARSRLPLAGMADHFVSEALYLQDPDDHGIEVYWDRPRAQWDGQVHRLTTVPLDVDGLVGALDDDEGSPFPTLPDATDVGHVHLQVADIPASVAFYDGVLGFDVMTTLGSTAAFLAAGGYHHHLGVNTWHSRGVGASGPGRAALRQATIVLPDTASLDAAAARMSDAGHQPGGLDNGISVVDPSGITLALVTS